MYGGIFLAELFVFERHAGLGRANLGAFAAVGAFIGIDYIFGIGGGDSILRACRQTGIAQNAIIGDFVSQVLPPLIADRTALLFPEKSGRNRIPPDHDRDRGTILFKNHDPGCLPTAYKRPCNKLSSPN
jgi:hypothetical protein